MRCIDADKLYPDCMTKDGTLAISQNQIANAPTVEERPQGKWGKHGECPFCSYIRKWEEDNFCGNCGADMRGKKIQTPSCLTNPERHEELLERYKEGENETN